MDFLIVEAVFEESFGLFFVFHLYGIQYAKIPKGSTMEK